jgi:hypothetical protein
VFLLENEREKVERRDKQTVGKSMDPTIVLIRKNSKYFSLVT